MRKGTVKNYHEIRAAYLFVFPAVFLLFAFLILPAFSTIRYAFTDYNILRPDNIRFCGLDNFIELFQDKDFKKSLMNTIYLSLIHI